MEFLKGGKAIDLEALLKKREGRAVLLQKLGRENPQSTLISIKLNIPGPIKNSPVLSLVFHDALERIQGQLPKVQYLSQENGPTGPEAILSVFIPAPLVKRAMVTLEESSPLARLYDIDVHSQGEVMARSDLELPSRRCLICDQSARYCARAQSHSLEELLAAIQDLILNDPGMRQRLMDGALL